MSESKQVNSDYFLDGKAIMDLFAKPVKINKRNYLTDVMRKMDSLLQDVWWYTEMSYGDIIITRGYPYQISPFDQNNPFIRIVRQWCDKGEYAREMYQALEEIKKLLKDEDHKAGEYWTSVPYQQLGYMVFPEETKQPT